MYKLVICATLVLALLGLSYSQSVTVNYPNASIIKAPYNASYSQRPTTAMIYTAESYLNATLGHEYYFDYINLAGGAYYGNNSYVYFAYGVPFTNNTISQRQLGITINMNASRIVHYTGPARPYFINISQGAAISTAESYGLQNDTAQLEGVFSQNSSEYSNYSIAWAVLSNNPTKLHNYYGIYVDAVTGNVIGEYLVYPYDYGNYSSQAYGTAGGFSLFYLSNATAPGMGPAPSMPLLLYVVIAILIIAIIIAVIIRMKPKKKSRYDFLVKSGEE